MRQRVVYIPKHEGADPKRIRSAEVGDEQPKLVWTLLEGFDQPEATPTLPIVARHHHNAFLEDFVHDWRIEKGRLIYYSRVCQGGCWVLLEYET
jgi:hypothetical protein